MTELKVYVYNDTLFRGEMKIYESEAADITSAAPIKSLALEPGVGVTLYSEKNFGGTAQSLTTALPSLSGTRFNTFPPKSLQTWRAAERPYSGWWAIRASNGHYVSIEPDRTPSGYAIRTSPTLGGNSLFKINPTPLPWLPQKSPLGASIKVDTSKLTQPGRLSLLRPSKDSPLSYGDLASVSMIYESENRFSLKKNNEWIRLPLAARLTANYEAREIFTLVYQIADSENDMGELLPGEVALFENPGYWGRTWLLRNDLPNFAILPGLNDQVSSIQFGPDTGATIYTSPNYNAGVEGEDVQAVDLVSSASGIDNHQIDNTISSIKIWRVAEPKSYGITHNSRVSTDYLKVEEQTELLEKTVYRTQISFTQPLADNQQAAPASPITGKIWTTEFSTLTINGVQKQVSETSPAAISFQAGSISVLSEAWSLGAPPLKLHLSDMPPNEYIVIFPDTAMYQHFAKLSTKTVGAKNADGTNLFANDELAKQAGTVLELAGQAVRNRNGTGDSTPSDNGDIDYIQDGNEPNKPPASTRAVFKLVPKAKSTSPEKSAVSKKWGWIEEAWEKTKTVFDEIIDEAEEVIVEPVQSFISDLTVRITDTFGKVTTFVLKTVNDISNFCGALINTISSGIEDFVEWAKQLIEDLLDLFDWKEVQEIKDSIVTYVDGSFNNVKSLVQQQKTFVISKIDWVAETVNAEFARWTGSNPSSITLTDHRSKGKSYKFDKLDWIFDQLQRIPSLLDEAGVSSEDILGFSLSNQTIYAGLSQSMQSATTQISPLNIAKIQNITSSISGLITNSVINIHDLAKNPQKIAAEILKIVRDIFDLGLQIAKSLIGSLFDLMLTALDFFRTVISTEMDIPVLKELYKFVTGSDKFSILDIAALTLAIPLRAFGIESDDLKSLPKLKGSIPNQNAAQSLQARPLVGGQMKGSSAATGGTAAKQIETTRKAIIAATGYVSGSFSLLLDAADPPESKPTPGLNPNTLLSICEFIRLFHTGLNLYVDTPALVTRKMGIPQAGDPKAYDIEVLETTLWAINGFEWLVDGAFIAGSGSSARRAEYLGVGIAMGFGLVKLGFAIALTAMRRDGADQFGNTTAILGSLPGLLSIARTDKAISATKGFSFPIALGVNLLINLSSLALGIVEVYNAAPGKPGTPDTSTPPARPNNPGDLVWHRYTSLDQPNANAWASGTKTSIGIGGWQTFSQVIGGYNGVIYGISGGNLLRYRTTSLDKPNEHAWAPGWSGIAGQGGWDSFKQVFGGHNEELYAITHDGKLLWYQYLGKDQTDPKAWAPGSAKAIAQSGWGNFKHVFGGHNGIIYAITHSGNLTWHRYLRMPFVFKPQAPIFLKGSGQAIGIGGWDTFKHVFGGVNGVIYAVTHDGKLLWYRNTSLDKPDQHAWAAGSTTVISPYGWAAYKTVFGGENGVIYSILP